MEGLLYLLGVDDVSASVQSAQHTDLVRESVIFSDRSEALTFPSVRVFHSVLTGSKYSRHVRMCGGWFSNSVVTEGYCIN